MYSLKKKIIINKGLGFNILPVYQILEARILYHSLSIIFVKL